MLLSLVQHGLHLSTQRALSYPLLMAAGMNAQDMEAKLVGDVDKAQAAVLKETDPINKAELRRI